jgi:hypothetical protein
MLQRSTACSGRRRLFGTRIFVIDKAKDCLVKKYDSRVARNAEVLPRFNRLSQMQGPQTIKKKK